MKLLLSIIKYLEDNFPTMCFRCSRFFPKHSMTYEMNNMGRVVPLCEECHAGLFKPFHKYHKT